MWKQGFLASIFNLYLFCSEMCFLTEDEVVCPTWFCLTGFYLTRCVLSSFIFGLYLAISGANVNGQIL